MTICRPALVAAIIFNTSEISTPFQDSLCRLRARRGVPVRQRGHGDPPERNVLRQEVLSWGKQAASVTSKRKHGNKTPRS